MNKVIYLAHPLSDDPVRNQLNAAHWGAWIVRTFGCAVSADWIWLSQVLKDDVPEERALGIEADKLMVSRCDELWLAGGRISTGMGIERDQAIRDGKVIRDLTSWGYRGPTFITDPESLAHIREFVTDVKYKWGLI